MFGEMRSDARCTFMLHYVDCIVAESYMCYMHVITLDTVILCTVRCDYPRSLYFIFNFFTDNTVPVFFSSKIFIHS
jgi:hypothetical protein